MNDFLASTPIFSSANVPTEGQLLKVVSCIGHNWMLLGIELGIPYSQLRNLRAQRDMVQSEMIFDMLMTWKMNNGNNATFQRLIQSMSQSCMVDIDWISLKKRLSD